MLPETHAYLRAPFYRDVEDLISPGFLSHTCVVAGVSLAFRTLCPGDLFLLRNRTGDAMENWQLWALASSLWMVNGHCLLDQPHLTPVVYKKLGKLPIRVQRVLFSLFTGLLNRQHKAEDAIEPYLYENTSRNKWRSASKNPKYLSKGVPGADCLGLNQIQQLWFIHNEHEDRRLAGDQMWDGFKLVASSNSPKGVEKIDKRDIQAREKEEARRKSVRDRFYYYQLGKVDREGYIKSQDRDLIGSRIAGPKSVEQLEQEMKRWVAGELDEHDHIVEDYKQRILDRQAAVEAEREERRHRLAVESEKRMDADFEAMPMVGYTPEQMSQILAARGEGGRAAGARFVYDEEFENAQTKTKRHLNRPVPGELKVQEDRLVVPNANPQADMRTLQELIQGRKVEAGDEPQQRPQAEALPSPLGPKPAHVSQDDWEEYGRRVNPAVFGGNNRGGG